MAADKENAYIGCSKGCSPHTGEESAQEADDSLIEEIALLIKLDDAGMLDPNSLPLFEALLFAEWRAAEKMAEMRQKARMAAFLKSWIKS